MMKNAPISDSGMAMVGIITDRTEHRKRKITAVTISRALISVLITSLMELFTYLVAS